MTIPYQKKERVWHDPDQTSFKPWKYFELKYVAVALLLSAIIDVSIYAQKGFHGNLVLNIAALIFASVLLSPLIGFAFKMVAPK